MKLLRVLTLSPIRVTKVQTSPTIVLNQSHASQPLQYKFHLITIQITITLGYSITIQIAITRQTNLGYNFAIPIILSV